MKDNEIISLFELRDEQAIEALSDKYHPYCYKIGCLCDPGFDFNGFIESKSTGRD